MVKEFMHDVLKNHDLFIYAFIFLYERCPCVLLARTLGLLTTNIAKTRPSWRQAIKLSESNLGSYHRHERFAPADLLALKALRGVLSSAYRRSETARLAANALYRFMFLVCLSLSTESK